MKNPLKMGRWSPYVAGAGIGVLSWVTFAFMGKALGTSTTLVNAAGVAECLVAAEHVKSNEYLAKQLVGRPAFNWQAALVVAMFLGGFAGNRLSGQRFVEHVPKLWAWRFGKSRLLRYSAAFLGGVIVAYGARMADGCTSGHGVSGGLQLAVSSWIFLGGMFAAGLATAFLMFGTGGRSHV